MATTIDDLVGMVDEVREQGAKARKLGDGLLELKGQAEAVEDELGALTGDLNDLADEIEEADGEMELSDVLVALRRMADRIEKQQTVAASLKDRLDEKDTEAKEIADQLE